MTAFVAYWVLVGVSVATWIAAAAVFGQGRGGVAAALREPVWFALLIAPPALAGLDLVAFARTHEQVCRLEAERHRWLGLLVGKGYSARTFAITGFAILAVVIAVSALTIGGRLG